MPVYGRMAGRIRLFLREQVLKSSLTVQGNAGSNRFGIQLCPGICFQEGGADQDSG